MTGFLGSKASPAINFKLPFDHSDSFFLTRHYSQKEKNKQTNKKTTEKKNEVIFVNVFQKCSTCSLLQLLYTENTCMLYNENCQLCSPMGPTRKYVIK